jgi:hypothetical protein
VCHSTAGGGWLHTASYVRTRDAGPRVPLELGAGRRVPAGAVAGLTWREKPGGAGASLQVAETTNGRTI